MNISLQQVWERLAPSYPNYFIGITLYVIIALAFLFMVLQKKSDLRVTLLCSGVIMLCLVDKVAVGPIINGYTLESFLLRIPMFVGPFISAGMTKWDKSRPVGVIAGVIGGAYLFSRWFFEQRGA